ncbi:hypothetical protein ACFLU6_09305 [Acidobacteriota bacterium]
MGRSVFIALLAIFTAAACNQPSQQKRYELYQNDKGLVARLDHQTGEVAIRSGYKLIALKMEKNSESSEQAPLSPAKVRELAEVKTYPDIKNKDWGDVTASLTSVWKNGKAFFRLTLKPYTSILDEMYEEKRKGSWLMLYYCKKGGFRDERSNVQAGELSLLLDSEGNRTGLEYGNWHRMSAEDYQDLGEWSLSITIR